MKNSKSYWVIGHKLSAHPSSGDFDLMTGETPVGVPGPPPHHHSKYSELFVVLKGKMEFTVNGETKILEEGESIDLPPNTVHTFSNAGTETMYWLHIHSPKGFAAFFNEYGVDADQENSFQQSISEEMIGRVLQGAASFDMHIAELAPDSNI